MRIHLIFILFVLQINALIAQTLDYNEYLSWIVQEHPLMRNAKILEEKGQAQWLQTKGLFDPVLTSKWKNKFYSETNYYQQSNTAISIPTPYAIGLLGQVDFNNGAYLNPDEYIPNTGLVSLGIQLPLLQGLMIDERRMAKKRATELITLSELEMAMAINELLYQSSLLYVDWYISEKKLTIQSSLLKAATERHEATKARFKGGDRAAIDTLESFIAKETRRQQYQDAQIENIKSRFALVAFKNNDTEKDLILNKRILPQDNSFNILLSTTMGIELAQNQMRQHPEMLWYQTKSDILKIEERWKKEKLKPKLNLEYHFLNKTTNDNPYYFSTENYRWGLDIQMPLFLREARGDLKLQQLKIQENENATEWKRQQIQQKSNALISQQEVLKNQFQIATQNSQNSQLLSQGELLKFNNGESSVFLMNQRENFQLDQQQKALEYERKWIQSHLDFRYVLFLPFSTEAQ